MKARRIAALVAGSLALGAAAGAEEGAPAAPSPPLLVSGTATEKKVESIAARLRCPVCQGMAINDSPATTARDMKGVVRQLVEQGKSEEEIREYFVSRYGEFVLLEPEAKGANLIVWIGPGVLLLGGLALAARYLRRASAPSPGRPGPSPAAPGGEAEGPEDPYLARARRILEEEGR